MNDEKVIALAARIKEQRQNTSVESLKKELKGVIESLASGSLDSDPNKWELELTVSELKDLILKKGGVLD